MSDDPLGEKDIPGARTLFVVRHGRTRLNALGLLRGHIDEPLDEEGAAEARRLGALFGHVSITTIISSPLRRARETAAPIAAATRSPVMIDDAFIDRDWGPWAGAKNDDVVAKFGTLERAPGIESLGALRDRVVRGVRRHAEPDLDSTLLVVAHDVVIRVMLARLATNLPDDPYAIAQRTGCWNRLERTHRGWVATAVDAVPGDGATP